MAAAVVRRREARPRDLQLIDKCRLALRENCLMCSCACACSLLPYLPHSRHAAAFVRTPATGLRTFLTMHRLMLRAFVAACFAYICAYLAHCVDELASASHVGSCLAADLCAIHDEGDTARHCFHIPLLQACACTIVASIRTEITGFNTRLVLLRCHDFLLDEDRCEI